MAATPIPKRGSWLVAIATALALLIPATPMLAASSPEAAVSALFERVAANDLDDLDSLVCPERVQSVQGSFGELAAFGRVTFSELVVSLVSQEGDTAVVHAQGSMSIQIEEAALRDLVRQLLAASGEEPTEEQVDAAVAVMLSSIAGEQPLDEDIDVVRVDGEWLVCDDLDGDEGPDASPDDGSFPPSDDVDVSGSLCDLLTLEELNALAELQYAEASGESGTCTYTSAASDTSFSMVSISLLQGTSLDELKTYFPDGEELSVAGQDAYGALEQLWVAAGEDVLVVTAMTFAATGDTDVDVAEYRKQIAQIVLPRLITGEL